MIDEMKHRRRSVYTFTFFMFVSLLFIFHTKTNLNQQEDNSTGTINNQEFNEVESDVETFSEDDSIILKEAVPIKEPPTLEEKQPEKDVKEREQSNDNSKESNKQIMDVAEELKKVKDDIKKQKQSKNDTEESLKKPEKSNKTVEDQPVPNKFDTEFEAEEDVKDEKVDDDAEIPEKVDDDVEEPENYKKDVEEPENVDDEEPVEPQRLIEAQEEPNSLLKEEMIETKVKVDDKEPEEPQRFIEASEEKSGNNTEDQLKAANIPTYNKVKKPKIPIMKPRTQKKILLVANYRTGSSFLGDLIQSVPGVFYSYEPLHFIEKMNRTDSKEFIQSLFKCQFKKEYLEFINGNKTFGTNFMIKNTRGMGACFRNNVTCAQPDFMSNVCNSCRINLIKVVRFRVKELAQLLESDLSSKDWKIIYLVRDPRGTMNSRMVHRWCQKIPSCITPKTLCEDTLEDVQLLTKLMDKNPDRFYLLKFEDFTANIETEVEKLFKFIDQPIDIYVKQFLVTHTKSRKWEEGLDNSFSVVKDTKDIASKWRSKLSKENITEITKACKPILELLDYKN